MKHNQFFFPSYNQLQNNIITASKAHYHSRLSNLKSKITKIKSSINLHQQHNSIKQSLLNLNNDQLFGQIYLESCEKTNELKWDNKNMIIKHTLENKSKKSSIQSNVKPKEIKESLNCCLEDDAGQDNHYESYMKFRKKVLMKQLEEEQAKEKATYISKNLRKEKRNGNSMLHNTVMQSIEKIKQHQVAENLFKNLYSADNKHQKNIKHNKTNEANILEQCEKNKKILLANYNKYLKDLSRTNIIKWRILNGNNQIISNIKTHHNNSIMIK